MVLPSVHGFSCGESSRGIAACAGTLEKFHLFLSRELSFEYCHEEICGEVLGLLRVVKGGRDLH